MIEDFPVAAVVGGLAIALIGDGWIWPAEGNLLVFPVVVVAIGALGLGLGALARRQERRK